MSEMPQELEVYSTKLCDFSYADVCSEIYNKLHLSPYFISNQQEESQNGNDTPPTVAHYTEYEGTGDLNGICLDNEGQETFEQEHEELFSNNNGNSEIMKTDSSSLQNIPSKSYEPVSFSCPPFDRHGLKIRYTRQYLLNLRKNPFSTAFPDCLNKYLYSDEVPLRCNNPEPTYNDYRNMDHILFYKSLPYSRTKHTLGTCMRGQALI